MTRPSSRPVPPNALQVPPMSPPLDGSKGPMTPPLPLDDPPDGGHRAWLVVLGSTLALFSTTGLINAYGVFQAYYTTDLLSESSSATISLIGGLQVALVYGGGPIAGRIFDAYGLNIIFSLGIVLVVLSQMLLSICQKNHPYQFFLSQGVMFGLGCAMIFTPALAVMGHWFKRRRAYVFGIVVAGSSLGGLVYPIMLQQLIDTVGFPWAVRISGFVTLACLIVARLTTRTRVPLHGPMNLSQIVDLHGFLDIRYTLSTIASFLYFYALFIPYFYIEEYANFQGVPPNISRYLLAIINGCGVPARIIPGFLGDRFGVLQVLIPPTVFSGAIVLALWLPARGTVPIILFSFLYGTVSSGFVSMLPAYIATISPVEKFGARLGTLYFFVAIATLVGTPTAGAFVPDFSQSNFNHLIIFTGVLLLTAAVLIGLAHIISKRERDQPEEPDHEKSAAELSSPTSGPSEAGTREVDRPGASDSGRDNTEKQ